MIDADAPVVIVIERTLAEARERQAVADALRDAPAVVAVEAHQGVLLEMAIECRARIRAQAAARQPEYLAASARQIAYRQGGEFGSDERGQPLDAEPGEGRLVGSSLADRAEQVERCLEVLGTQLCVSSALPRRSTSRRWTPTSSLVCCR